MTSAPPADQARTSANEMWGGRFSHGPAEAMEQINVSIDIDRRLYAQDIAASKAHAPTAWTGSAPRSSPAVSPSIARSKTST
jgi:hypothetical protein